MRAELEAYRLQSGNLPPRGHNRPPELIGAEATYQSAVEIIWAGLGEAADELEKPAPSPSLLRRIGAKILEAAKAVGVYVGGLADEALREAAKGFGKWAGLGLAAYLVTQTPQIQSIAGRILDFAKKWEGLIP